MTKNHQRTNQINPQLPFKPSPLCSRLCATKVDIPLHPGSQQLKHEIDNTNNITYDATPTIFSHNSP